MELSKKKLKKIEDFIRKTMRQNKVPGLSIGIIKDDKILHAKGYGYRDLEQGLPMTENTLIGIGSVTKSFTSFAIMKLVSEGKIAIDDSAAQYLPQPPFSNHPEIKIKHLLSHSSGIPAADGGMAQSFYEFGDFKNIYPVATKEDFFYHISAPEDYNIFPPEEKFFYNNDMFICLGFIIEKLTGKKYAEYIHEIILRPLNAERATFSKETYDKDPLNDKIRGYMPEMSNGKQSIRKTPLPMYGFLEPPGGLYISSLDMLKYAQLMLNRGKWGDSELLAEEHFANLWNPIIDCPYGFSSNGKYALGWVKETVYLDTELIHHGGGLGTSCTSLILAPEHNLGIFVGQNSCNISTSIYSRYALAELLDRDPEKELRELRMMIVLEEITGVYLAPHDLYKAEISLDKGVIQASIQYDDGEIKVPLIPSDISHLIFTIGVAQLPPVPQIQFIRNKETKKIEFLSYDRYLYRKK